MFVEDEYLISSASFLYLKADNASFFLSFINQVFKK